MNIFMAAIHSNGYCHTNRYHKLNDLEKQIVNDYPNKLESYHYIHKDQYVEAIRNKGDTVFLDSGAFSAWTLGTTINIDEYCNYIKKNIDIMRFEDGVLMASVLDGIGDPQQTYENQMYMQSQGVTPLPCFHFGEDERYLQWYVKNYDYITIGGMVGKPVPQLIRWLDRIWTNHMIDAQGNPRLKVHAFGITSVDIMKRYPWFSVDSSSWIQAASFGAVITPDHGPIHISDKSPNRHKKGQHFESVTPAETEYLRQMLLAQGFDAERLSTVYESRAVYNINSFAIMNKRLNDGLIENDLHKAQPKELF